MSGAHLIRARALELEELRARMPIFQDERERTKALRVKNSSLAMACGRVGYVHK